MLLAPALFLARRTPLSVASAGAWVIATLWWFVLPIRRRVAMENLHRALPALAPRRVLMRMMHDLALNFVEAVQFENVSITVEGFEAVGNSVLLGGHGGNWEATLYALGERAPTAIFLRTPSNPWVAARLAELRATHRVVALETGATMADATLALARGESVIFVQDQKHRNGLFASFFNAPAQTSAAFAVAAQKSGRPAYAFWQWREGTGRHRVRVWPIDTSGDVQAVTEAGNRFYEARIREHPHGWLWLHRRWG